MNRRRLICCNCGTSFIATSLLKTCSKHCRRERSNQQQREYRLRHPERILEYNRKYRLEHGEEIRKRKRKWGNSPSQKEKRKIRGRLYRKLNGEKIRARRRLLRRQNPEIERAQKKRYRDRNLERVRALSKRLEVRYREQRKEYRKRNADRRREVNHQWKKANRERVNAVKRYYYSRHSASELEKARMRRLKRIGIAAPKITKHRSRVPGICDNCGNPLSGQQRRFCSRKCCVNTVAAKRAARHSQTRLAALTISITRKAGTNA